MFASLLPLEDNDAAIRPHRIGEHGALIHRPISSRGAHIWISYSLDLATLGQSQYVPRRPPRCLVGREQDRDVAAAHRNRRGMACHLPWGSEGGMRVRKGLQWGLDPSRIHSSAPFGCRRRSVGARWSSNRQNSQATCTSATMQLECLRHDTFGGMRTGGLSSHPKRCSGG